MLATFPSPAALRDQVGNYGQLLPSSPSGTRGSEGRPQQSPERRQNPARRFCQGMGGSAGIHAAPHGYR